MRFYRTFAFTVLLLCPFVPLNAGDWPIYKGNLYFTGNNDGIIVKNNNLKWLFQADARTFNPIVSDGLVYFVDIKNNVYCLNEENGKSVWKFNLHQISSRFNIGAKASGKIKYPIIDGNTLFLSDSVAIYAIDKRSGAILWAKTGTALEQVDYTRRRAKVDGIYADPVVTNGNIVYGTRNNFFSRKAANGDIAWKNSGIKSYSGFPTYYDRFVFTQSMDYTANTYTVFCLDSTSGTTIWSAKLPQPFKIFPPVVYKGKVYIPVNNSIYCLDLKTGSVLWNKEYGTVITSIPGFTDKTILFAIDNSTVVAIDPGSGKIMNTINTGEKSAPYFVTINDLVYIAYNKYSQIKGKSTPFTFVQAANIFNSDKLFSYKTPFPGANSQPSASQGILFIPAGNYVYAIGTEYYNDVIDGGDGYATTPGETGTESPDIQPQSDSSTDDNSKSKTRKIKIKVTSNDGKPIQSQIEIKKRDNKGTVIYQSTGTTDGNNETIIVPAGNDIELLATSPGYIPKKVTIDNDDKNTGITLDSIEKGKSYSFDNIFFEKNKAYLKKESIDILDKIVLVMKDNSQLSLEISGHTDSDGDKAYNQSLSEKRAESVAEYLIKNGISPEKITTKGYGESSPLVSNDTEEGKSKNRRTEFKFN